MDQINECFDKSGLEQIIANITENDAKQFIELRAQYVRFYGEKIDEPGERYIKRNFAHENNMMYDLEQIRLNHESDEEFKKFEDQAFEILQIVENYNNINHILTSNFITLKDKNRALECIKKTVLASIINKNVNYLVIDLDVMAPVYQRNTGCYFNVYPNSRIEFVKYFNPNETKKIIFESVLGVQTNRNHDLPGLYDGCTANDIITELCKIIIALKDLGQKNLDNSFHHLIEKQLLVEILRHPLFLEVYFTLNEININDVDGNCEIVIDLYDQDTGRFFKSCGRKGEFNSFF